MSRLYCRVLAAPNTHTAISHLITMGTASRVASEAFGGIVGLEGLLFLKSDQAARLGSAPQDSLKRTA